MSFIKQTLMEHRGTQSILSLEPVGTWVPALYGREDPKPPWASVYHTFACKIEAQKHNLWITDLPLGLNEGHVRCLEMLCWPATR